MPTLTLAQLASHATRLAGAPATPLSLASEYVNLAYAMVAQSSGVQHAARETVAHASTSTSTTTAENRLALPSDFDYAIGVRLGVPNSWSTATSRTTTWKPLPKQPASWFETCVHNSDLSAEPEVYGEFATWLELSPSPNSAYSVEMRYARKITEMTASTATPILDEQWHWAIALKASELLASTSAESQLELRNARRYMLYVQGLRVDQTRRRMDERGMRVAYVRTQH